MDRIKVLLADAKFWIECAESMIDKKDVPDLAISNAVLRAESSLICAGNAVHDIYCEKELENRKDFATEAVSDPNR
jgi:hypothetical protein